MTFEEWWGDAFPDLDDYELAQAAWQAATAAERERCAKVAEGLLEQTVVTDTRVIHSNAMAQRIAAAIREDK